MPDSHDRSAHAPQGRHDSTRPPRTRTSHRGGSTVPTTVWPCTGKSIDLTQAFPHAIVAKIVTAFSRRNANVVVVPYPEHTSTSELTHALNAIRALDRSPQIRHVEPDAKHVTIAQQRADNAEADLVLATIPPEHHTPATDVRLALLAASVLRPRGIFVALSRCSSHNGKLIDPASSIVSASQSVDLLYLQHIIAIHQPLRPPRHRRATQTTTDPHKAHQLIHSDLLVFVQPPSANENSHAKNGGLQ